MYQMLHVRIRCTFSLPHDLPMKLQLASVRHTNDTPRKMKSRSFETNPTSDNVDFVRSLQTAHHRAAFLHSQTTGQIKGDAAHCSPFELRPLSLPHHRLDRARWIGNLDADARSVRLRVQSKLTELHKRSHLVPGFTSLTIVKSVAFAHNRAGQARNRSMTYWVPVLLQPS